MFVVGDKKVMRTNLEFSTKLSRIALRNLRQGAGMHRMDQLNDEVK